MWSKNPDIWGKSTTPGPADRTRPPQSAVLDPPGESPEDAELTSKGRRPADEAVADHLARERRMVEPLVARERAELARLTRKLLAPLRGGA